MAFHLKRSLSLQQDDALRGGKKLSAVDVPAGEMEIDRYRSIVFPNNIRLCRRKRGLAKLLALSQRLPDIPYIRLSKIERGEVFAKPAELAAIAGALKLLPADLLIDIDDDAFDMAEWAADVQDPASFDPAEDHFAVLLAAAIRHRREADAGLTIAALEKDYGIAPVMLSRLENAFKPIGRWNDGTVAGICRLMDVADVAALRERVAALHAAGALDAHLRAVANPEDRKAKTRARVAELRTAFDPAAGRLHPRPPKAPPPLRADPAGTQPAFAMLAEERAPFEGPAMAEGETALVRLVPVFGAPIGEGLIQRTPMGTMVEAPRGAGPNAYGLRVCRPTLGPALPARATVIVDPDRFPTPGGIAVVRETEGLRLLTVGVDRDGRMTGYSAHPDREIAIDALDPIDVATVIGAIFD